VYVVILPGWHPWRIQSSQRLAVPIMDAQDPTQRLGACLIGALSDEEPARNASPTCGNLGATTPASSLASATATSPRATNADLAPRNLVLEARTGNLWLLDWD
jgi:hypothetical protein